ncbi:PREDICTED: meiosis arrest female protein 1 homolog [Camelina sativa]|uniref:Meiosis arrest female protein 1 homolog n=1 Tax=Camelina sativa TaxID=90675 RepID=A0ABM1R9I5_CAMSA|nr:PREDICTED: meiosis arrest female protein 1 homolog [Camelina sativa]
MHRDMNGVANNDPVQQPMSFNVVGLPTAATMEAELAIAKTSVWWDFENCMVPKGCDGSAIAHNIKSALLERNYCGPITIYAYGDTNKMSSSVQQSLSATALSLIHVPPGVKDGSDKKILVDMLLWAMENKAPAKIMLISGDRDFAYALHQLGMKKYNILLAQPEKASPFLIAAAKTVWFWRSIVAAGSVSASKVLKQAKHSEKSEKSCEKCSVTFTCEKCSLADFNSHLSSNEHKKKLVQVAGERSHVTGLTEAKHVWCRVCQTSYNSEGMKITS